MSAIESFLDTLKRPRNSSSVANPYRDAGAVNNLRLYLEYMMNIQGRRVLLVGEAPGFKGCRITGIPFTSGRVVTEICHPLFNSFRSSLSLPKIVAENTATIVWQYLSDKTVVPLFWNSFPFHPHPVGNKNKNRAPNKKEIQQGARYLKLLFAMFEPDVVAGIGAKGVECANKAFPELVIEYVRHPSYGGKSEFIAGMDKIIGQ